jgi:LuxR family maltose regulon positive regulatory protein
MTYSELGEGSRAAAAMVESLNVAPGQELIRLYADEGPVAARLLYSIINSNGVDSERVTRLLAAFSIEAGLDTQPDPIPSANSGLMEPLSERELEVLRLMAVGLGNKDIGDQLFISPQTVKTHTRNIYGKLDTHSRIAAVSKARLLGLLADV